MTLNPSVPATTESLVNKHARAPEESEEFGRRWLLGASLLIVADIAFVLAILFSYLYLNATDTGGGFHPRALANASLVWPWVVALCMCAGLACYVAGRRGEPGRRFVALGGVSVLVMLVALVLNVIQMLTFPFPPSDNAYAGAVMLLAGANVFHLLLTLFLGAGAVNRARLGLTRGELGWHLHIVEVWYAWVCVAALVSALVISVANGATR